MEPGNNYPLDMLLVAEEGLTHGSLIWVTDGSYNRKRASNLSGTDNLLQENGILHHKFFLGAVNIGHLVQGRTPWTMRLALSGPGSSGVLQA